MLRDVMETGEKLNSDWSIGTRKQMRLWTSEVGNYAVT